MALDAVKGTCGIGPNCDTETPYRSHPAAGDSMYFIGFKDIATVNGHKR